MDADFNQAVLLFSWLIMVMKRMWEERFFAETLVQTAGVISEPQASFSPKQQP
jgi:hypothetical protein